MREVIDGYVKSLTIGEGATLEGMTLFPVFWKGASPLRYKVLSEALADGSVEVREKGSATVPELYLVNRSDSMVLVMGGEEVVGGKQNRMVNTSFLIGPKAEVDLAVTCLEQGRWRDVAPRFSGGETAYHSLRRTTNSQVREHLRSVGAPRTDQGVVWDEIAEKQRDFGVKSSTGAMHDIYKQTGKGLSDFEEAFPLVDGAVGLAVGLSGKMTGVDVFDQPETAARLWSRLIRSYAMDALHCPPADPVGPDRAKRLLERLAGARAESYPSPGLGQDVRLEGDGAEGSALVYENVVVHLAIFRTHELRPGPRGSGMASASRRQGMRRRTSRESSGDSS